MPPTTITREGAPAGSPARQRRAGPALAALATGTVAAYDPWGFVPAGPLRWTAVTAATLAAAVALAGHTVGLRRGPALAWLALLAWLLAATVAAVDPLHAWIGTPDRRLGWLAWVVFALAFACGQAVSRAGGGSRTEVRVVVRACALAAGALGAVALVEAVGWLPGAREFAAGRLGGPFAQPAYLGAAAALLVPVAAGLAADAGETRRWRGLAAFGGGLGAFALLASQSRAAWVGVAVAAAVLAGRLVRAARRKPVAAALAVAALAALAVATPLGGRAASIAGLGDGGPAARLDEWRVAAAALGERPLLGAGPEGYRVVFPAAVDAAYTRAHGRDVIPDRAHNGLLDAGAIGGLPALAAYLALLAMAVAAGWRVRHAARPWLAGTGAGVVAYAVQQQFLFPLAELDPLFWMLAGVVTGEAAARRGRRAGGPVTVRVPRAAGVPLAALAFVALAAGGLEVASDRALRQAATATGPFDHPAALALADRATALRPDSIRAWFVASRVAGRGTAITALDAALDRIESGLERSPGDPALRTEHAALLLERAQRSGLPADLDRALAALHRIVDGDPYHPGHRLRLAAALELAGDGQAAAAQRCAAADLAGPGRRTSEATQEC